MLKAWFIVNAANIVAEQHHSWLMPSQGSGGNISSMNLILYDMKIGLVDVDGHSKKRKWGATIYPNIALGKISRWHKSQGDDVEWALPMIHYDKVYMSKIFNFTQDVYTCYDADVVIKGGTGYDINSQLPYYIDSLQPDYTIFPYIPKNYAYGFLTRGCPNKCPWCVVPRKEGTIRPYMDCDEIAIEGRTNLVLMDNNIIAAGDYALEQLEKIIHHGYRIDFNQAVDARLMTNEFAKLFAKVKWIDRRIRFGCDTHAQIDHCERAIEMINSYGYRGEYFLYTMLNDNFNECFDRLNYWWKRNRYCREKHLPNIYPYAQPYRDLDNPKRKIPMWQHDMANWVNKHQIFQITDFSNFSPRKGFLCKTYLDLFAKD